MANTFRKVLALLMVLCVLVPLFGFAALAADAEDLPIDYRFEDVDADDLVQRQRRHPFDGQFFPSQGYPS